MAEESTKQSSSGHGGKRKGAGRKPSTLKGVLKCLPKQSAELILQEINAQQKWKDLLGCPDLNIQLKALMYLTDRAYGKAAQAIEHSGPDGGPIQHEHIDISKLSDSQLSEIAELVESAFPSPDQG